MLSEHFNWGEALFSQTAQEKDLDNTPDDEAREAIKATALGMEAIRSLLGGKPIKVTSWYRSPDVNKAVGGSATSDHMSGWSVDFKAYHMDSRTAARIIRDSPLMFDQLILYPGEDRLHIGFSPKNRREVMTKSKASTYAKGLDG